MALVRIYNPASGNFAHAPESALPQMPKWRKARPGDGEKERTTKESGGEQASAAENKENS